MDGNQSNPVFAIKALISYLFVSYQDMQLHAPPKMESPKAVVQELAQAPVLWETPQHLPRKLTDLWLSPAGCWYICSGCVSMQVAFAGVQPVVSPQAVHAVAQAAGKHWMMLQLFIYHVF